MKKWLCIICGWIYDEAKGWPADGIAPGTRWQDIPQDWVCPDCGVAKADFEMLEISESTDNNIVQPVAVKPAPFVIIGGGYAGYNLAAAIGQQNPDQDIVVFTTDEGANYSKPGLSNALARKMSVDELVSEPLIDLERRLNIRVYARCEVQRIDAKAHKVSTDFGEQPYTKLILAIGSSPISLNLAGTGAKDVLSVNSLEDYRQFRELLESNSDVTQEKPKHITIIGNGLIGCEFANDLAVSGYTVTVVGLSAWAMDKLLPQAMAEQLQTALAEQGVSWHTGKSVQQVEKHQTGYRVTLSDNTEFATDLVLSAIGLKPNTQLALSAGIHCKRGIVVNGGLRTDLQDIYALGDCAEINGQLLPFIAPINHGIKALAACLLGRPTMAQYPLMPIIIKTSTFPLTVLVPNIDVAPQGGKWELETTTSGMRGLYRNAQGELIGFALASGCVEERQYWLDQISK